MSNYQMDETHLHSSTLPLKVIPDTSFLSVSGCGHLNDMSPALEYLGPSW